MSTAGAQNQFFQFKILNHSHHGCLLMWCELGSAEKHAMKSAFPRQGRVQWEERRASIRPVLHPQGCRAPGDGGRHTGTTLLRKLEFKWPVQKRAGTGKERVGSGQGRGQIHTCLLISSLMPAWVSGSVGIVAMLDQRRGLVTCFRTTVPKSSCTCVKSTYRTRLLICRK